MSKHRLSFKKVYNEVISTSVAYNLNITVDTLNKYLQTSKEANKVYKQTEQEVFKMLNTDAIKLKELYIKDN